MPYRIIFLLILSIAFMEKNIGQNTPILKGKCLELIGQKIYLKDYDPFQYASEAYLLDSCFVADNGEFQFNLNFEEVRLITLSTDQSPPPSYQVLREAPEMYYFSFCANFFAMNPTLIIEPNKSYQIQYWDNENREGSIVYGDEINNLLRSFYRKNEFLEGLPDIDDVESIINSKDAWKQVQSNVEIMISSNRLDDETVKNDREMYFTTEIKLGAVNEFLTWLEMRPDFVKGDHYYRQILDTYLSQNWHPLSLEYYKLSERFITYQMTLFDTEFKIYIPSSKSKIDNAQKWAKENIKEKYVQNLKNVLVVQKN